MTEVLYTRPEIVRGDGKKDFLQVEKTLSAFERIYRIGAVRKAFILFVLAAAWEIYGRWLGNPLLFPSFSQTFAAFSSNIADGTIPARALASIKTLLIGYGIGIVRNNAVPRLSNLPEPGCFELWFRPGMLLFFR